MIGIAPLLFRAMPLSVLFGLVGPYEGLEHLRHPPRIESVWDGLREPGPRGSASNAIATLRMPRNHRVYIAGGRFVMGSTPSEMQEALKLCAKEPWAPKCLLSDRPFDVAQAIRAEGHAHEVTLAPYELDKTEVTVERYARCVAAAACSPPAFPPGDLRYDQPELPVTHVTWQNAASYCAWAGARLPTEAEWELAARGYEDNVFPWGKVWNPHVANHGAFADDPADARDGFVGLAPVGSFPDGATKSGILDLAGNAAEWVADWYERDEQQFGYARAAAVNPKGPAFGSLGHVVRGGSYRDGAHWLRTAARRASLVADREVGFRCAKSR